MIEIKLMKELPLDFDLLVSESKAEGFGMMEKMKIHWLDGSNRFGKPGEIYLIARDGEEIVGGGGLNIDPYTDEASIGRVRHLYIRKRFRRKGIAKEILLVLIKKGVESFSILRLRTENPEACRFYESLGFDCVDDDEFATHKYKSL
ncbi:MAG: GNAT family N-acetyltransferase [Pseudobacteriovorax sp.]|nr:GNAT family N-acetyltransferase [Pseudobacteriovorax sp.]